jgi:hypothetical protein
VRERNGVADDEHGEQHGEHDGAHDHGDDEGEAENRERERPSNGVTRWGVGGQVEGHGPAF